MQRTAKRATAGSAPRLDLRGRDPADPIWRTVELAQRGRLTVDVAAADLAVAERQLGPFHPTACAFRAAWADARNAWDRLRARVGGATLDAALAEGPRVVLPLGPGADRYGPDPYGGWPVPEPGTLATRPVLLIPIAGQTYRALRIDGTALAPRLWRLDRLDPPLEHGPYHAGRLRDGSTRCDCAEWIYQIAETELPQVLTHCKHLAALAALGWL